MFFQVIVDCARFIKRVIQNETMRKVLLAKNVQAIVSLKANPADDIRRMAGLFKGAELDFSDRIDDKTVKEALCACEKSNLDVKAIHLPNPRRLAKMCGSRKIPGQLLDIPDMIFILHAWMRNGRLESDDIARLCKKINGSSSHVAIENMSDSRKILSNPTDVKLHFSKETTYGFCLDTSHPVPKHGQDYTQLVIDYINAAKSSLAHIHLSDADPKNGRKHLPLGKGEIEWARFFGALKSSGYGGLLTLEFENASPDDHHDSIMLLSANGISLEPNHLISLLSLVSAEDAALSVSRFVQDDGEIGLVRLFSHFENLFIYSDEHNRIIFFDKSGGEYAPLLRQMDFPRDIPDCTGFLAAVSDPLRVWMLYMNRKEKVAVRRTLQDLNKEELYSSIKCFMDDIDQARKLSVGTSSITRMADGKII